MNPVYRAAQARAIQTAYEEGYGRAKSLFIDFVVTLPNGDYNETVTFPFGQERDVGNGMKVVTINISASACKYFTYDTVTGDFVYDVSVNGSPFLGNIPVGCITHMTAEENDDSKHLYYQSSGVFFDDVEILPVTEEPASPAPEQSAASQLAASPGKEPPRMSPSTMPTVGKATKVPHLRIVK